MEQLVYDEPANTWIYHKGVTDATCFFRCYVRSVDFNAWWWKCLHFADL